MLYSLHYTDAWSPGKANRIASQRGTLGRCAKFELPMLQTLCEALALGRRSVPIPSRGEEVVPGVVLVFKEL